MPDNSPSAGTRITTSRRLMVNTVLNLVNQVITVIVNFAMVGFFLDTLGEERYGIWILIGSIFSYRNLMSMGLNSAVNRNIPIHLARGDLSAVAGVVSTAFAYFLAPALILSTATLLVAFNIESWFAIPAGFGETASRVTLIVGLSFALTLPLQVYNAVLSSYQRYDLINMISVTSILLRTLLIVFLLQSGHGLLTLAVLYAGAEVSIRALSMVFGYRLMSGLQISPRRVDSALLAQMMTYGVSTILYMSGAFLVLKSADMVIGALISTAAVSQFFIATTPILLLTTIVQVFSQAMKPAVSELDEFDEQSRIREMALIAQKYTLFAILPGLAFIFTMGGAFLNVWVGERYPDPELQSQLETVLQILAIGTGLRLSQHTNFIVLIGKGQHRAFGIATAIMLVASVILQVAAIVVFDAGLVGVALGCCIPMAVVSGIVLPAYFNRRMHIGIKQSCKRSFLPATIGAAPGVIVIVVWANYALPTSWPELFGVVFAAGAATALGVWIFALDAVERARIRRLLPL